MAAAKQCDIKLLFVPAGGVSKYQPSDYRISGELKPREMAEITKLMAICNGVNIGYDQSIGIFIRS
jgi:hypothetical protein